MIISQPIVVISNSSHRKIVYYSDERILNLFLVQGDFLQPLGAFLFDAIDSGTGLLIKSEEIHLHILSTSDPNIVPSTLTYCPTQ